MTEIPYRDAAGDEIRTRPHRAALKAYEAELEAAQSHPSAVLAAIETFNAVVDAETARKG